MNSLRFYPLWLLIGLGLVGLQVYASLSTAEYIVEQDWWLNDKLLHLISYCGLMLWFMQLFPALSTGMLVGVLLMALGLSLEYLQGFTEVRTFDWLDQAANMLGIVVGWVLALAGLDRILIWLERLLPVRPLR